ncbi:U3 snoRNP protein [Batrachochytrium dendrobatidis]|nr:U3 snoRNP protein [Batrachochytrium dendrobatidis]
MVKPQSKQPSEKSTSNLMQVNDATELVASKASERLHLKAALPSKIIDISSLNAVPFLTQDAEHSGAWLDASAWLFKMVKTFEPFDTTPLPELYTKGFDLEQVWEQIRLLNEPLVPYLSKMASDFPKSDNDSIEETDDDTLNNLNGDDEQEFEDDSELDESELESDQESSNYLDLEAEEDNQGSQDSEDNEELNSASDNEEFEVDFPDQESDQETAGPIKRKRSVVDDDFFSLEEMEKFADMGERHDIKAARKANMKDDDSDDDESEKDDMFSFDSDILNSNLDDEDEDNANDIRYEDFFEGIDKDADTKPSKKQRARPSWQDRDDMDRDEDIEPTDMDTSVNEDQEVDDTSLYTSHKQTLFEDDAEPIQGETLSTFEKQQARLQKAIQQLESEAMQEKPWAMKGEVSSRARPKNSLLEEDLEIEHTAKPVPVITEESTLTLETLITQRIKDQVWDDVTRKAPPKDTVYDPNRKFELIDEKSTKSLAQVYEDEYLRQSNKDQPTEKDIALNQKHEEVKTLFQTLCQDLDILSNWHYTPKAATLEVEVLPPVSVPAIQMEEVTPAAVSDAMLAAPKEVYQGNVAKSQMEMDAADKRKARLKAKREVQREHKMRETAKKEREAATGVLASQLTKEKAMKQLMGQSNVTIVGDKTSKRQMGRVSTEAKGGKTKLGKRDMQATVVQVGGKVGQTKTRIDKPSDLRL